MKTNYFKEFLKVAETNGLLDPDLQCRGYLWINLTDRQLKIIRGLAILQGLAPDKNGNIKCGNYILKGGN